MLEYRTKCAQHPKRFVQLQVCGFTFLAHQAAELLSVMVLLYLLLDSPISIGYTAAKAELLVISVDGGDSGKHR